MILQGNSFETWYLFSPARCLRENAFPFVSGTGWKAVRSAGAEEIAGLSGQNDLSRRRMIAIRKSEKGGPGASGERPRPRDNFLLKTRRIPRRGSAIDVPISAEPAMRSLPGINEAIILCHRVCSARVAPSLLSLSPLGQGARASEQLRNDLFSAAIYAAHTADCSTTGLG